MYLLLCGRHGTGKRSVSHELIKYFSYRYTACYMYNFMSPLEDIEGAADIVVSQNLSREEIRGATDGDLASHLYSWGKKLLGPLALKQIGVIIERWEVLKLHHITVVRGVPPAEVSLFGPAFKVLLTCNEEDAKARIENVQEIPRKGGHPLEIDFDDCAVCDIFDLVVDTSAVSRSEAATLIGESLHDKMLSPFKGTKDRIYRSEIRDDVCGPPT